MEDLRDAWAWKHKKDRNEGQVKKTNISDKNNAKSQKAYIWNFRVRKNSSLDLSLSNLQSCLDQDLDSQQKKTWTHTMQDLVLESQRLVYIIWMFCVWGGKDLLPNVSIIRRILNIQTGKKHLQEISRHQIGCRFVVKIYTTWVDQPTWVFCSWAYQSWSSHKPCHSTCTLGKRGMLESGVGLSGGKLNKFSKDTDLDDFCW